MGAAHVLDERIHSGHYEIKNGFALAHKLDETVVICGITSSNRACDWILGECMGMLCCGK